MSEKLEEMSKEDLIKQIKSLKKQKKFGIVFEDNLEDVQKECQDKLPVLEEVKEWAVNNSENKKDPTNLIIEGDNYHALSVLNYTHANSIDLIYIDPPYNTGANDWKYNNRYVGSEDAYRHSKWLAMMEHRLEIAKNLLKEDGVLICAIDENEQAHLCVMLEEIFTKHDIHVITVVHNPRGVQGNNFSYTHEYAVFVIPKGKKTITDRKIKDEDVSWSQLRNWGTESQRSDAKNCFYPITIKNGEIVGFGDVLSDDIHPNVNEEHKDGSIDVYPIDSKGVERKWRYARQSVEAIKDLLRAKQNGGVWQIEIGKNFGSYKTVWQNPKYDGNEYGTRLIKRIVPGCDFDFPKSLWNTYDALKTVIVNNKNAVVLDYFAGSGTTGHAVLQLNKEDNGHRQFILCTNNENKIAEEVTYPRVRNVIKGYNDGKKDVKGIPGNLRYFKTKFVDKQDTTDDTREALVKRCTDMIRIRENTYEEVVDEPKYKFYKNSQSFTAIIFDQFEIENVWKKVEEMDTEKLPVHLYVFSYNRHANEEEIPETDLEWTACPIPESVLEVYKKIFKVKKEDA